MINYHFYLICLIILIGSGFIYLCILLKNMNKTLNDLKFILIHLDTVIHFDK